MLSMDHWLGSFRIQLSLLLADSAPFGLGPVTRTSWFFIKILIQKLAAYLRARACKLPFLPEHDELRMLPGFAKGALTGEMEI